MKNTLDEKGRDKKDWTKKVRTKNKIIRMKKDLIRKEMVLKNWTRKVVMDEKNWMSKVRVKNVRIRKVLNERGKP